MIALFKNSRCGACGFVGTVAGSPGTAMRICAVCAGQATGVFLQAGVDSDKLAPLKKKAPVSASGELRTIIDTVARYYDIAPDVLAGKLRTRALAAVRDVAMFLCKQETQASSTEICAAFGGREHTLLSRACSRVSIRAATEPALETDLAALKKLIHDAINLRKADFRF